MKRQILLALVWGAVLLAHAQGKMEPDFRSPFDFPLLLSANFGELRPNHFHNGLDIKTGGVTGKPIYSVAEGYVSRVMVLHGGYGQALFVTHPNGFTSVYSQRIHFGIRTCGFVRSEDSGICPQVSVRTRDIRMRHPYRAGHASRREGRDYRFERKRRLIGRAALAPGVAPER